jgi:WD40 repeat protein/Leucine-rich repeat (LRR) protein
MRYFVLILALLGGAICTTLAWYWKAGLDSPKGQEDLFAAKIIASGMVPVSNEVRAEATAYARRPLAVYFLAGAAPLAFLGGLFGAFRKGIVAGSLLGAAFMAPIVILPTTALVTGILLPASVMAVFVHPVGGKRQLAEEKEAEGKPALHGEKIKYEEEDFVEPIQGEEIEPSKSPSPPVPMANIGCPKCKTPLRIPNPQAGKVMKCPSCAAGFKMPEKAVELARAAAEREAERLAAERGAKDKEEPEELVEPEEPQPVPKKGQHKAASILPALIGSFLLVASSVAASGLIVTGVLSPEKGDFWSNRAKSDGLAREVGRDKRSDKGVAPDPDQDEGLDELPDFEQEARRRSQQFREHQTHEKQSIPDLRKAAEEMGEDDGALVTFTGHERGARRVAWSPDGKRLASTDPAGILIWQPGLKITPIRIALESIREIAFSPTGSTLASISSNGVGDELRLWDSATGNERKALPIKGEIIDAFAWLPDGKTVVLSSFKLQQFDSRFQFWNVETARMQRKLDEGGFPPDRLVCSPDGKTIAGTRNNAPGIKLWDVRTGKSTHLRDVVANEPMIFDGASHRKAMAFSPDSKTIGVLNESLQLIDLESKKRLGSLQGQMGRQSLFEETPFAFSPDGKALVSCIAEADEAPRHLRIWDPSTRTIVATVENLHKGASLRDLAFSPGGELLATLGRDNTVKLWAFADLLKPRPKPPPTANPIETIKKFAEVQGDNNEGYTVFPKQQLTDDDLATIVKLPRLVRLLLGGQRKITDAGFAHLKNAKSLQELALGGSGVTGAGLAPLAKMKQLKTLDLSRIKLGDKGLDSIKELTDLISLRLPGCELTDGGLSVLKELTRLTVLDLNGNEKVTDAGLAHLVPLTAMKNLSLSDVPVTDAGLAHLKGMTKLQTLLLSGEGVTDAGFAHLAGLTAMVDLELGDLPNLKGPGLQHLKGMSELTSLELENTGVTDEGLQHLKGLTQLVELSLPERITDAGFVHLASLVNLETLNGLQKNFKGQGLQHLKGLKKLRGLNLTGSGVDDAGLEQVKGLTQFQFLKLPERITDAGLAHLAGLTNLKTLSLHRSEVSDTGLAHLKGMKALTSLQLSETKIGEPGLAHLAGLTTLTALNLLGTKVSDAALVHLKGMKALTSLTLSRTPVGDAGLVHLKDLSSLVELHLRETKITDAGLKALAEIPKLAYVEAAGTTVSEKGVAELKAARPRLEVHRE